MKNHELEEFDAILDAEREALLKGDFTKISELLQRKQVLVEQLGLPGAIITEDEPVLGKLRRNLALYDQALAGLRAAAERIGSSRKIGATIRFYGQYGHTQALNESASKNLEKRA